MHKSPNAMYFVLFLGGGDECTNVYKKKHLTHDESFESNIVDYNFDDYSAFMSIPNNIFFRFLLKQRHFLYVSKSKKC